MASKDVYQTHNEYKERENRIKLKKSFDEQKDEKANEMKDILDQITKLKVLYTQKEQEYNEITSEEIKELSIVYNDKEVLANIVKLAPNTTCSPSIIADIEKVRHEGINDSNTSLALIEEIALTDEKIYNQIRHTGFVSDLLDRIGGRVEFPDEEEKPI